MILVTGGLGMIGAHTARALSDLGAEVVVTTHRSTEVPGFLPPQVRVEPLDMTDRPAVLAFAQRAGLGPVTDIVHLAGSVPGHDPVDYLRADTAALLNALEAARTWNVRRFAVASSLGVYLGGTETRWHEELLLPGTVPPHPIVGFKKAVEPLTTTALAGSDVQPVLLRIGSVWGPLMDPNSPFNPLPPYVSTALRGERLPALAADDGGDHCYAPDAGRAIALLLTVDRLGHDVYNVSSGRPITNTDLAAAVRAAVPGSEPVLTPGGAPGPTLDIGRLVADTGFAPRFDLPAAVADYVGWRTTHAR
jgi:nucleoside-diphosphate-sugar epimerase